MNRAQAKPLLIAGITPLRYHGILYMQRLDFLACCPSAQPVLHQPEACTSTSCSRQLQAECWQQQVGFAPSFVGKWLSQFMSLLVHCRSCSLRTSEPQRSVRNSRSRTAVQASAVEVFQLADEGALIGGTAAVLFACTLVVSALAAVLLRLICNSVRSSC